MKTVSYIHHKGLLVLAFITCVFVGALYGYVWHQIYTSIDRSLLARSIVAAGILDKNQSDKILKLYAATADERALIQGHFIPSADVVLFIETLEKLGAQAGSTVRISGLGTASPASTLGTAHAHVDVSGSWQADMRTLLIAETLPYTTTVDNVRLGQVGLDTKGSIHQWQMSFDVTMLARATTTVSKK